MDFVISWRHLQCHLFVSITHNSIYSIKYELICILIIDELVLKCDVFAISFFNKDLDQQEFIIHSLSF